jgi:hypothetical protein
VTFDKSLAKGLRPDIVIRKLQYEFLDIGGEFFFKLKHNITGKVTIIELMSSLCEPRIRNLNSEWLNLDFSRVVMELPDQ